MLETHLPSRQQRAETTPRSPCSHFPAYPPSPTTTPRTAPAARPIAAVAFSNGTDTRTDSARAHTQMTSSKPAPKMAGLSAERFQQHPPRPPIQAQHSSSVPSTPYQQPRDMRFSSSRSPSPHRGLSNQSPRSVVSEAVVGQQHGSQRHRQVNLCRYELGAETRKRRIPYADCFEHALGPPKKEPKKSLAPYEEERLSGDMRELYDRLLPSEESEDRRRRLVKKLEKMLREEWPGNDIRVNVFGSSGNLLSSSDSDVDICITTPMKELERMHELAALLDSRTWRYTSRH